MERGDFTSPKPPEGEEDQFTTVTQHSFFPEMAQTMPIPPAAQKPVEEGDQDVHALGEEARRTGRRIRRGNLVISGYNREDD